MGRKTGLRSTLLARKSSDRGAANDTDRAVLDDAVSALVNLGYRRGDAFGAVTGAMRTMGGDVPVEELIRAGLKELTA